jgi:hypothetical protein
MKGMRRSEKDPETKIMRSQHVLRKKPSNRTLWRNRLLDGNFVEKLLGGKYAILKQISAADHTAERQVGRRLHNHEGEKMTLAELIIERTHK